jgi:hypothetical protein
MKAQLELNTDSRILDANSTLRVTYGKVKGMSKDATLYTQ